MKTEKELEKAIKDSIIKYKEIMFSVESRICTKCQYKIQKQDKFDEIVYRKKSLKNILKKMAWDKVDYTCKL